MGIQAYITSHLQDCCITCHHDQLVLSVKGLCSNLTVIFYLEGPYKGSQHLPVSHMAIGFKARAYMYSQSEFDLQCTTYMYLQLATYMQNNLHVLISGDQTQFSCASLLYDSLVMVISKCIHTMPKPILAMINFPSAQTKMSDVHVRNTLRCHHLSQLCWSSYGNVHELRNCPYRI